LIDRLLWEQQQLSAVEQFAQSHHNTPAQAKYYSKLLPASPPGDGQQYGFEVDLDGCSGCKACVTACHSLNGLDEEETWRDVGLLIGGTTANPVMQHVTTACHHCLEPGCLIACPVDAYEKNPVTGIVKHLDDQCFGCQYCTLACPYDVPKYHHKKGIVRKCDLCSDRLTAGEAPACAQACPHEVISIKVVEVAQVRENAEADPFLPAAPEPHLTLPTTTYKSRRVFPRNMLPADYYSLNPQHPHWPLIVMLVLTQLSVGAFAVGMILDSSLSSSLMTAFRPIHASIALAFGLTALAASTLHLGRPLYAFRAVIGLRHSWLSREIVAFGGFAGAGCLYAAAAWLPGVPDVVVRILGWTVFAFGAAGVFCSVMIYAVTRREFWSFSRSAVKFFSTAGVLGLAAAWLSILILSLWSNQSAANELIEVHGDNLAKWLIALSLFKLTYEASLFQHLFSWRNSALKRSALLTVGALSSKTFARFALGFLGGIAMPLFLVQGIKPADRAATTVIVTMIFIACFAGEMLERFQFFAAVSAPRMPGNVRS
jgi:formate dehydrogenase iron-sulfur subunit